MIGADLGSLALQRLQRACARTPHMWGWGSEEKPASERNKDKKQISDRSKKIKQENDRLKAELAALKAAQQSKATATPGGPSTAPQAKDGNRVGAVMAIQGLAKRSDLNGRLCRLVAYDEAKDAWAAHVEGEPKRMALKPSNICAAPVTLTSAQFEQMSALAVKKKKAMTTRAPANPSKGGDGFSHGPSSAGLSHGSSSLGAPPSPQNNGWAFKSASSPDGEAARGKSPSRKPVTEREEIRQRLYAPLNSRPPRAKAAVAEYVPEADPFASTASADGKAADVESRPPFVVPQGKRRTRTAQNAPINRTERTNRDKPRTARGSPTTWAQVNKHTWEGRTGSPTGRFHPNAKRRADVRGSDLHMSINYYATTRTEGVATTGDNVYEAPDNDRKMKEASFVASQAWFESLRHYPRGRNAMDSQAAYSGYTHGSEAPAEHLETDLRTRLGIAAADPDWQPKQLQQAWAPEPPLLANRLAKLRSKLRGVSVDSPDIAVAGSPDGPDLWA